MNRTSLNVSHLIKMANSKQRDISEATGISQSKISRIVNGQDADYSEAVLLGELFKVPVDMLINEDLSTLFRTPGEYNVWVDKRSAARQKEDAHQAAIQMAPIRLMAIQEHYIRLVSKLTGQSTEVIGKEIDNIYQLLLSEQSKSTT